MKRSKDNSPILLSRGPSRRHHSQLTKQRYLVSTLIGHCQWVGVKSARKTYKMFLEKATVPYPIYCKCIEIEKSMEKQSMKRLRDLYDKVTNEWGADHPDLWLDYITSETGLKGGDPTRVGSLHWKAMKTLNGAHTADFVSKYSLLHLNS
ncbi:U3 small nucleolar RNA-associated protein 6 homolog [Geodia barretti]|uniref:U3 small nucleolar RNA-associated protein 6 homolog n=1 Tax=Geodia barretti TaxID=519541 RepID=A0AA35SHM8_GEOBA|nr:U3 small nucleolar RNA-associated protein 6 homolog [Geodia barretti]